MRHGISHVISKLNSLTKFLFCILFLSNLFNCGEGTDRLGRCSRIVRWPKVQNIFLTGCEWSRIGGMIAAMNEMKAGCSNINFSVYGPEKLRPIIERMASIVELPEASVKFNCTESYIAPGLRIDCLRLGNNNGTMAWLIPSNESPYDYCVYVV